MNTQQPLLCGIYLVWSRLLRFPLSSGPRAPFATRASACVYMCPSLPVALKTINNNRFPMASILFYKSPTVPVGGPSSPCSKNTHPSTNCSSSPQLLPLSRRTHNNSFSAASTLFPETPTVSVSGPSSPRIPLQQDLVVVHGVEDSVQGLFAHAIYDFDPRLFEV